VATVSTALILKNNGMTSQNNPYKRSQRVQRLQNIGSHTTRALIGVFSLHLTRISAESWSVLTKQWSSYTGSFMTTFKDKATAEKSGGYSSTWPNKEGERTNALSIFFILFTSARVPI